ncbi:alanine/glycine:cation symporter family protein [Virgibacillus salexigens]|uniref:Amino-acid carrier protein AlsT n=1 Tax=Virgibacillus massiliensis TaxID=1462526 RepID=A0A024QG02_9BACI|nr:alanine/glycine:cation symporter family protein [Virgibacillus massiliensis]MYL42978.1 amino acid carrier protein [Virgibacillus massiliensis]CDQ40886.1 Amino-acid carrier protein AlsT [Virgibacillus massiliensis]
MDQIMEFIGQVNGILSTYLTIPVLLGAGLFFTIFSKFVQFRYMKETFRVLFEKTPGENGKEISAFKSFCIGSATRIGTGNLAGVAVAITMGGPGAVFWMWIVALVGGATAFFECTLAQVYKIRDGKDAFRGGPAYYIEKGLKQRRVGIVFAILIAVTFGLIFNSVQSNTIAAAVSSTFNIPTFAVGLGLVVISALIIFGGVHRVANFSSVVVPIMAGIYCLIAFVVVAMNITALPDILAFIISNAFGFEQVIGGGIGAAIMQGVNRGLFSNEAGMGSAPNAAASSHVSHPVKQGFIQAAGVFLDTLVVCTATAFIILVSDLAEFGSEAGITLLQDSLTKQIGSWASIFVTLAIFLFAFSSIAGSYYYGEKNIEFIRENPTAILVYRVATLGMVMFGSIASLSLVWALADVFMGLMTMINMYAVIRLSKVVYKVFADYMEQRKANVEPVFEPRKLGIEEAVTWERLDFENVKHKKVV